MAELDGLPPAVRCPARLNDVQGDVRCCIWTNADPDGRHFGDHNAYGKRWANSNPPPKSEAIRHGSELCAKCHHAVRDHEEGIAHCCGCLMVWDPLTMAFELTKPSRESTGVVSVKLEPVAQDSQVGGDHYRKFKIQPWDIWAEYGLDAFTGAVIKYLLRAGHKGSKLEDLRKARHTLDRLIEIEEGKGG